ncbi:MAG: translation initiation factor IF-3 [Thermodesulfobacteriota bacterium]
MAKRGTKKSQSNTPEVRINNRIRAKEIRLIDVDGNQLGLKNLDEALQISEETGVDLVEIAPNANPPVCRLMDFGKFKYELKKQQAAKKQKVQALKEIKFRPNIGDHDLEVKINHIKEFLDAGHKTRVRIFFRGREIVHPELGRNLAERVYEMVKEKGSIDMNPKMEGKNLIMVLSPKKK